MNFLDDLEGAGKKFISVLDLVAVNADKGLVYASHYAIPAAHLAALLFPEAAPGAALVETAINLLQHSVLEMKAKAAALPAGLSSEQMLADELHLAAPAAITLLQHANIKVDTTRISNVIKVMATLLNAREAPAPAAPAEPVPASV